MSGVLNALLASTAAVASPATATYASGTTTAATSGGTCTFATQGIGTASGDRYVVVGVTVFGATGATAVTVAGTSCTKVVERSVSFNTRVNSIWITNSAITSGTTASIVVTAGSSSGIVVFALTGLQSATATATNSGESASPTSFNLAVSANGAIIAHALADITGTYTWTNLTKDADGATFASEMSGAHVNSATAQTISVQAALTSSTIDLVAAAWR